LTRQAKDLTPEEASRALYVDFEGEKDKPPILLGCAHRPGKDEPPWVPQFVTSELFALLAVADELDLLSLPVAVERIIQRAESKDRRIVAWSEHELKVVKTYCPEHLERFDARFVNARSLAERWRNKCHDRQKPPTNRLADYLDLIGHEVPEGAGAGKAGTTIRRLRISLQSGRGPTGDQRQRWVYLRDHNRHDCAGMRKVCLKAAEEIAAWDAKKR
jgi:hypothetical protein